MSATEVIQFWFDEIEPAQRFRKDLEFDTMIRTRFLDLHTRASKGLLYAWRDYPLDALAEIIILDQFSRNLFRVSAEAFVYDTLALVLAQEAIRQKFDEELEESKRAFLYMPFMHSEVLADQQLALQLFAHPGLEDNLRFARHHHDIIKKFGRFPHRNKALGRESSEPEIEYLNSKEAFSG